MEQLRADLRLALRALRRAPLFTTIAVATLALGIGVGTTLFAFVEAILLRPLPVARPQELVTLFTSWSDERWATTSRPDLVDLEAGVTSADLLGHAVALATLERAGKSRVLVGELLSGDGFSILGIPPERGRLLAASDDRDVTTPRVVVVSDAFWRRELGADPRALGQPLHLNGRAYEIVGVVPPSFRGLTPGLAASFWVPTVRGDEVDPAGQINSVPGDPGKTVLDRRGYRWMWVKGRLHPGATVAQVRAQAAAVMARLQKEAPRTNEERTTIVEPISEVRLHPEVDKILRAGSTVLLVTAGLLLLVICANLANMALHRALERQKPVAIRLALGAGRGRLVRQLLIEQLVLAFAGAALALLLARWTIRLLGHALPTLPFDVQPDVGLDLRVALFALLLTAGAGIVCALVPARRATRPDLIAELRGSVGSSEGHGRRGWLRDGLVVTQVAVSMLLLVGAGLLVRSLAAQRSQDLGLVPRRVAAVAVDLAAIDEQRRATLLEQAERQASELPGVAAAAVATRVPFDINARFASIFPDGATTPVPKDGVPTDNTDVSPAYFAAIGVPLLRGRAFDARDRHDAPPVAIVNATLARKTWGTEDVVGKTFRNGRADGPAVTIVGVVADYKVRTPSEEPRSFVHFPLAQHGSVMAYLLARANTPDARPVAGELQRLATRLDSRAAVQNATTLDGMLDVTLYPLRMGGALLGALGALALLLASLGLYGVIASSVARRGRELGIRLALGESPHGLQRQVLAQGMTLVGVGIGAGAAIGLLATRALGGVLHGVSAIDPLTFAAAAALLALAGAAANLGPARRASRTAPWTVLRGE